MINKIYKSTLVAAFVFIAGDAAKAQILISNFTLTPNSVSFNISGTLLGPAPQASTSVLYFVNPTASASPGFARGGGFYIADTRSFTGSQALGAIGTGNPSLGDYFSVNFINPFTVGQAINGLVQATWSRTVFNTAEAPPSLNLYWGIDATLPVDPSTQPSIITGGTLQNVPEPSAISLLAVGLGGLALLRRGCKED